VWRAVTLLTLDKALLSMTPTENSLLKGLSKRSLAKSKASSSCSKGSSIPTKTATISS
jgi:hypothetical protein